MSTTASYAFPLLSDLEPMLGTFRKAPETKFEGRLRIGKQKGAEFKRRPPSLEIRHGNAR